MAIERALFRSARTDWETPPKLVALLDREFGFALDVCASWVNHQCSVYFTRKDDGLRQRWHGTCWMNPPYGHAIKSWLKKAVEESAAGATVVCLVPARTDTTWWQDLVMRARDPVPSRSAHVRRRSASGALSLRDRRVRPKAPALPWTARGRVGLALDAPRSRHQGRMRIPMKPDTAELPMTVRDAARFLGVSPQTVYLWVERRQIPHLRVMGRNIRFLKSDLEPFRTSFKQEVENGTTA